MKEYVKKIVAGNLFFSAGKKDRFVFLFHDISEESELHYSQQYSTTPAKFHEIIDHLIKKFEITGVDKVLSHSPKRSGGKPLAAISFDDGFYSVFKKAYPYLKQRNIPFTIFVNKRAVSDNQIWFTNLVLNKNNDAYWQNLYDKAIDKDRISIEELKQTEIWKIFNYIKPDAIERLPEFAGIDSSKFGKIFCDSKDLKEMHESGLVLVHSHSVHHFILSECERKLSYKEIKDNKLFIEAVIGAKDDHFALPFGKEPHFDLRILEQCKDLGYRYIYTTSPNAFNINDIDSKKYNLIPRISITNQSIKEMMFMINMGIVKKQNA